MDHFFVEIYESIVYQWILLNQDIYKKQGIDFHIDEKDPNKLFFYYKEFIGEIHFWTHQHIIEEIITNKDEDIIFYLHFRIMNLAATRQFIQDFFKQMVSKQDIKYIGMSCTCGITSSLFVEKIQQLSQMFNLPYHFQVIPLHDIQNVYKDYDMIILAPQTSYLEPKIKAICQKDCYVMSMDASVFATSHYQKALAMIQEKLNEKR